MYRPASIIGVTAVLAWAGAVRGEEEPLKQALALEAAIVKAVAQAETSVTCILVSRSEAYRKWGDNHFGRREPGQLGGFVPPQPVGGFRDVATADLLKRLDLAAAEAVPDAYGSGVVIDSSGLILTNYHVVKDATKVFVRVPNKGGWYADIHAADERSDLAVLKLIETSKSPLVPLPVLPKGDAAKLKKGQFVLAVANPFAAGFRDGSPSVSWGLLSNIRRRIPGEPNDPDRRKPRLHYYGFLLQTDLRLNLGCSGGALLDLKGNWVGLTTSQAALAGGESAGGYAIPLDERMKRIIEALRRGDEVEYGFLGITLDQTGKTAVVGGVTPNGPAAKAGLELHDRIIAINGFPVDDQDDLLLNVGAHLAGTEVRLTVQQPGGSMRDAKTVLVKSHWPWTGPVIAANRPAPVYGLRVDYTSTLYRNMSGDASGIPRGVVVRDVAPDTPAASAGLKPDSDIITAVNGIFVNTPREFYAAARKSPTIELTLSEAGKKVRLP
jgi:S1-C subfamily serine protease